MIQYTFTSSQAHTFTPPQAPTHTFTPSCAHLSQILRHSDLFDNGSDEEDGVAPGNHTPSPSPSPTPHLEEEGGPFSPPHSETKGKRRGKAKDRESKTKKRVHILGFMILTPSFPPHILSLPPCISPVPLYLYLSPSLSNSLHFSPTLPPCSLASSKRQKWQAYIVTARG